MAINNFVPEIWSANLLKALRAKAKYTQAGVINRNYEGDIAQAGDTVHITSFADPSIADYTKGSTTISYPALTDATRALIIDQAKYWSFSVDDIDKRQALSGFVAEVTAGAASGLSLEADSYVADLMVAAVDGTGNDLGAETVGSSAGDAYDLLVEFRTTLTRSEVPADGRFVIVPPEFYGVLLKDDRFVRADASGTTSGLRNGVVGRAAGFDVIEGTTVPETSGNAYQVIAGHPIATTYAEQIVKTEAIRLERRFEDGLRGLHVYGGKVLRPEALSLATVTVSA
jgi:hypothetical protein